jgi:hypothetical protein
VTRVLEAPAGDPLPGATLPEGPAGPRADFAHRRLILVAAGPARARATASNHPDHQKRSTIDVLAKEVTPTPGRVEPRVTSPYRLITIPQRTSVYVQAGQTMSQDDGPVLRQFREQTPTPTARFTRSTSS